MKFIECKLSELGEIVGGSTPFTKNESYYGGDIPWLTPKDLANFNGRYINFGERNITEAGYKSTSTKMLPINSVLFSSRAPIGYVAINNKNEVCTNQGFKSVIPNSKTDYMFLYYLLKYNKNKIEAMGSGTTFKEVSGAVMKNIIVNVPEAKEDQIKIGKILSKIDDKIELNTQTNDNLYELGDAVYKEYYSKYENELPNGYKYLNLNEVSVNFDSKRKPMSSREREQHKGTYPYYGATSIIDYVDDYIFDDTYLLMGEDGTVKTSEGYPVLQYIWGKNWINNHAHVLQGTIISTEHIMFALRKKNIEALVTGAVQPKINQVNMNKIKIIIGTDKVNKKFEEKIKIIVAKIKANTIENETLIQLRDTLLPKLMNGEIDLDKIEI